MVITFLFLEVLLLPFRQIIVDWFRGALGGRIPPNFSIVWECTAVDEVLLLASAIWWSGGKRGERLKKILIGSAVVEVYNAFRILVLVQFPDRLLHDILFRWGGFVVIIGTYYILCRQEYKHGRA